MSNLTKHEHADWCNYKHGRCECGAVDQKQPKEATIPEPREWLIRKRGYYYRPNRAGYTASVAEAGRYTKAEAENEAALEPWHMAAVHESAVSEPRLRPARCAVGDQTGIEDQSMSEAPTSEPLSICPFCGGVADIQGRIFHRANCDGLQSAGINKLQVHILKADAEYWLNRYRALQRVLFDFKEALERSHR